MSTWYALRKAGFEEDNGFELTKWDDNEREPLDRYVMFLPMGTRFLSCNCPSRSHPCKHWDIAKDLLYAVDQQFGSLSRVVWQDGEILYTHDT